MADGTVQPIEDIEAGEVVASFDVTTGEVTTATVSDTSTTPTQQRNLVTIGIDNDGDGQVDASITSTAGHAFWVGEEGDNSGHGRSAKWIAADKLAEGSWIRTATDRWLQAIDIDRYSELTEAHNLAVAETHTYFVQVQGNELLTHNCPPLEIPSGASKGQWLQSRAADLGYTQRISPNRAPFDSHQQTVFYNPKTKTYITADIDGHNTTNGWKMFDRKGQRVGTYDSDLNYVKE